MATKSAIFHQRLQHEIDTENENLDHFYTNNFFSFGLKLVLFFTLCRSMMFKLGSEFLNKVCVFKMNI